jgi:2-(1,2-epoxy-1,2-dihydrophenyl)acetyl-CoA isomerase
MNKSGAVLLEKVGGLGILTLARPDKLNALSSSMRAEFGRHVADVAEDPEVKVVLLRGEGRAFCAGADLVDAPDTPLAWRDRVLIAQSHHLQLARMRKPVIAAVQGVAVGGGASMALAADILIMAEDAKLVFPFVRLGLVPDGGMAYLLQAKLQAAIALDLLLSGGTMSASEAARVGLTRRVVPVDQLDAASRALAGDLLKLPWEALMLTKALCAQYWASNLQGALSHEADAFALASSTEGHKRALAAMRQKLEREGQA